MNLHLIYRGPARFPLMIGHIFLPLLVCYVNDHVAKQGNQTIFTRKGDQLFTPHLNTPAHAANTECSRFLYTL